MSLIIHRMSFVKYNRAIVVILVLSFLAYSGYLYSNLPVKETKTNEAADYGKIVWQELNCNSCHQLYGLGGFLGPDLTNVYSIKGPDYIKAFVKSGTPVMPKFNLRDKEMKALVEFLKEVDQSGKSDPRSFQINKDGTIVQ